MTAAPRAVTYEDLGGIEPVLEEIKKLIENPLQHPEVRQAGSPPCLWLTTLGEPCSTHIQTRIEHMMHQLKCGCCLLNPGN